MVFKVCLNAFRGKLGVVISIILILSCVYNYIKSSYFMCKLEKCSNVIMALFPRTIAIACVISRIVVIYNSFSAIFKYDNKIEVYEHHFPVQADKTIYRYIFIAVIVFFCFILIIPINLYRLYLIYYNIQDNALIAFFCFMYLQNINICVTEIQFILYCFGLYQKFQSINEDMSVLRSKTIVMNKYPLILKSDQPHSNHADSAFNNYSSSSMKECTFVNSIELLKMRHKFVSNSVADLNDLYNIQLTISLSTLLLMMLIDIYDVISMNFNSTKSEIQLCVWLIQYSFRFCMILLITNATTRQVILD